MRALILFAAAASLAGCSRPVSPPGNGFAQAVEGRVPGPAQSCITTNSSENIHALDPQTLAYGSGRTVYINRLAGPCPGLGELNTLIVEGAVGGQYCRGDRVRGREPNAIIAGPSCNLGDWVPYRRP
jgi:hypothetical protein